MLSEDRFTLAVATGYLKGEYRGLGIDFEQVAVRPPHQPHVVSHGLPEGGPEPRHVDRKAVPGLGRRLRIPEPVNEGLDRDQRAWRQQQHGQDLGEVGERGGVLERVRGVGIEEAAAVGAEHLDGRL